MLFYGCTIAVGRDPFSHLLIVESPFCYALISVSCFHQLVSSRGYGLPGYWFALVGFQWVKTGISNNYAGKIHP